MDQKYFFGSSKLSSSRVIFYQFHQDLPNSGKLGSFRQNLVELGDRC